MSHRHVDAGRDALAGDEIPVDDVAGAADHGAVAAGLHGVLVAVVGVHPAATRRAGVVQEQGSGADACGPLGVGGGLADPAGDHVVGHFTSGARAAWYQEDVQWRVTVEQVVGSARRPLLRRD